MAKISSVFKMEDKASNTFIKTAKSMDDVITKADRISQISTESIGGDVSPALQQAINKYNEMESSQDRINAKIELMTRKQNILRKELAQENNAYSKNEKKIISIEGQLQNIASTKDSLIKKSDKFTKSIEDQAKEIIKLSENTKKIKPEVAKTDTGLGKWTSKMLVFNQTLQAGRTIMEGMRKGFGLSDNLTLMKARLDLINDGTQTTVGLQNKLYQASLRSRGLYEDMANSVAKLGLLAGDAFSSNDEMVAFSEMLNKSFKVSGAGTQEVSSATYQLTQAMAAGKLQGDEFRSIMENAPMLADAIAKYMGKSKGELKELSSEGLITADIIKNALFSAAGDINDKFEQMPKTFGDEMNEMKNIFMRYIQPIADKISELLNSERFKKAFKAISKTTMVVMGVLYNVFNVLISIIAFFADHMYVIIPLISLLATALYIKLAPAIGIITTKLWAQTAAWMAANWQIMLIAGVIGIVIAVLVALKAPMEVLIGVIDAIVIALAAWKVAQWALNSAMYACPIVWIIVLVIAVIAAIVLLISWILKLVGSTNSALGIIVGSLAVAAAFVGDLFLALLDVILGVANMLFNIFGTFANFFGNLFNDPIGSIVHLFGDFADVILGLVETIAKALDTVFGSNLAKGVSGWRKGLDKMIDTAAKTYGNGSYEDVMETLNLDKESLGIKRFEYGKAWDAGLQLGNDLSDAIAAFDPAAELQKLLEMPEDVSQWGGMDPNSLMDASGNMPVDIKKNSDKEVDISDEDLKMLKDIATKEYMLNYKQITPNVNISFGDVRETADVNQVRNAIQKMMEQELSELYVVEEG